MSTMRTARLSTAAQSQSEMPATQPALPSPGSPPLPQCSSPTNGSSHGIERLLTSKEASEVLKIHPKVLERMAKRGEVPALKVGKFWRYRATALDSWINSRLQSGRQPCRMETSF
jgi:excisionase family DNA binding protein